MNDYHEDPYDWGPADQGTDRPEQRSQPMPSELTDHPFRKGDDRLIEHIRAINTISPADRALAMNCTDVTQEFNARITLQTLIRDGDWVVQRPQDDCNELGDRVAEALDEYVRVTSGMTCAPDKRSRIEEMDTSSVPPRFAVLTNECDIWTTEHGNADGVLARSPHFDGLQWRLLFRDVVCVGPDRWAIYEVCEC